MKKFMSLIAILLVLVCTLWFSAGNTSAAGTITFTGARFIWGKGVVFVFEASGYRNSDVKDASITIGSKSFDVHCTVNKKEEKIVCVAGGGLTWYAGQTGVVYLAGQGFYVTIPSRSLTAAGCGGSTVMGANVTFQAAEGDPQSYFLAGQTLGDVGNSANSLMDASGGFFTEPKISKLECGSPTLPGFLE
jgi:type 1 fimbria pilin